MILHLLALMTGITSVVLVYLGFQGEWDGKEYLWAVPVLLALASAGALLIAEERRISRERARRETLARERTAKIDQQQIHSKPSNDGLI